MLKKILAQAFKLRNFKTKKYSTVAVSEPEEIVIKFDKYQIAGKFWNRKGTQIPVVAAHGWLDNAATWDRVCPLLSSDIPFFSFDFCGTGYSTMPPGMGTQLLDGIMIFHQIINHFQWDKVNILGHSMGGGIGMFYSGTFPNMVNKLILMDLIKAYVIPSEIQYQHTKTAIEERCKAFAKRGPPRRFSFEQHVDKLVKNYAGSLTPDSARILLKRGTVEHEDGLFSSNVHDLVKTTMPLGLTLKQQMSFARNLSCDLLIIKATGGSLYDNVHNCKVALKVYEETCRSFNYVLLDGTHHMHLNDPKPVAEIINGYLLQGTLPADKVVPREEYLRKGSYLDKESENLN